jgi:dTDP-4-dehydrorhamnose reductase
MDITNHQAVHSTLKGVRPWAVINAAGYTRIDRAEREQEECFRSNVAGATLLAEACGDAAIRMISFSSDHVFDGKIERPYVEADVAAPLNVYGMSKLAAEKSIAAVMSEALIIRTNSLFGPWDVSNFVADVLCRLRRGERVRAASDAVSSATYIPDLIHATLDLLVDGEAGIWHLGHDGPATWMTMAMNAAKAAGVCSKTLEPCQFADLPYQAVRPRYSALSSDRGRMLPALENALKRYVGDATI